MRNADINGQLVNLQIPAKYIEEDEVMLFKYLNRTDTAVSVCLFCLSMEKIAQLSAKIPI